MMRGESDQTPKARIYLDLDGVIYPIQRFSETKNVDPDDVAMLHDQADHEWWRKSIVRRLGRLGAEIVMSSSWGESFIEQTVRTSPLWDLKPTRALPVSFNYSKQEAVADDLAQNPTPFVWIDDQMNQSMIEYVKQRTARDLPGLYVKPYKMQGMTHAEIDGIEKTFLQQLR